MLAAHAQYAYLAATTRSPAHHVDDEYAPQVTLGLMCDVRWERVCVCIYELEGVNCNAGHPTLHSWPHDLAFWIERCMWGFDVLLYLRPDRTLSTK